MESLGLQDEEAFGDGGFFLRGFGILGVPLKGFITGSIGLRG